MTVQFGATTYTSLAKGIAKAVQSQDDYQHTLKGHLADDKRVFQVRLVRQPLAESDTIIITGHSQNPKMNPGRAYRESIPLKKQDGWLRNQLKQILHTAISRAKSGDVIPEADFPEYLQENVQKILSQSLLKPLGKTIKSLSLTTYKEADTTLAQAFEKGQQELRQFITAETQRVKQANSQGKLSEADRDRAESVLNALEEQYKPLLENPGLQYLSKSQKVTQLFERGAIPKQNFIREKLQSLESIRENLEANIPVKNPKATPTKP